MKHLAYLSVSVALLVHGAGCLAQAGDGGGTDVEQDVSTTTYVDIMDFAKIDQGQWYDIIHGLNAQFAGVCGDTFCEGDWANLTPLTFGCSVSSKAGDVKDCAWTFASSAVAVDPRNAAIVVDAPTFQCHIKAKTTAVKLAKLLSTSPDSLHAPLPGAASIYDQLADCFAHPIGSMPGTFATTGTESYVSASDYYTSAAGQARWRAAQTALVAGFDRVCGDTFCGSDFGDLQSLDVQCAVTKSTGNVKSCAWVFGGSYHVVPAHGGALDLTSQTFRCNVAVGGTLSKLIDVLTAPGTEDAIHRPLPGTNAIAYDSLGGCLP